MNLILFIFRLSLDFLPTPLKSQLFPFWKQLQLKDLPGCASSRGVGGTNIMYTNIFTSTCARTIA